MFPPDWRFEPNFPIALRRGRRPPPLVTMAATESPAALLSQCRDRLKAFERAFAETFGRKVTREDLAAVRTRC